MQPLGFEYVHESRLHKRSYIGGYIEFKIYGLNSLNGGYIGDCVGEYRGYSGGYEEFRLWVIRIGPLNLSASSHCRCVLAMQFP